MYEIRMVEVMEEAPSPKHLKSKQSQHQKIRKAKQLPLQLNQ
jgi:hypothetical protein